MSTKKKVQFSNKNKYKKYKREEDEEGDEHENGSDASGNSEEDDDTDSEQTTKKKAKHSLDSDEEDNVDKYKILNKNVFNEIGQEAKTSEFDGEIKLTPFNMKDELDEGNFDTDGYYHWKSKDKDEIRDAWLDNIDWNNINSFKKSESDPDKMDITPNPSKPRTSQDDEEESSEEEEDDDKSPFDDSQSKEDESSQIQIFRNIFSHLKPGETILKAIKRLGKTSSSKANGAGGTTLSASQRWLKKKQQSEPVVDSASKESAEADKKSLDKLTGYANHFIDQGFYDIYDETYEKIQNKIKDYEKRSEKSTKEFDIFADEVNESELSKPTPGKDNKDSVLEDKQIQWVYKEENSDDAKILGPFTTQQMIEKSDKGEFKESGVWCRRLEDNSSNVFYNSKRIDFDLYT